MDNNAPLRLACGPAVRIVRMVPIQPMAGNFVPAGLEAEITVSITWPSGARAPRRFKFAALGRRQSKRKL